MQKLYFTATRFRKISGNPSENSSGSMKEIRIWKPGTSHAADDDNQVNKSYLSSYHGGSGSTRGYGVEERLVFVAGDRKIPFAICSVIPSQKSSAVTKSSHRYDMMSTLMV